MWDGIHHRQSPMDGEIWRYFGWWNPYGIPCFRTKPWILVTSSWASQPDAANLQELRPQVLRQLRWLVRWGAWKLSENLGTPKISKLWPFLSIFNRENEMENGDDPLELGIPCRQTRVCGVFLATPWLKCLISNSGALPISWAWLIRKWGSMRLALIRVVSKELAN